MEVFVRNVPHQATSKDLQRAFVGPLGECGIQEFHVDKIRDKPLAILTLLNKNCGQQFLHTYGVPQNSPRDVQSTKSVRCSGRPLICALSRNAPHDHAIQSLAYEAARKPSNALVTLNASNALVPLNSSNALVPINALVPATTRPENHASRRFRTRELQCGQWGYEGDRLVFITHYKRTTHGSITFGRKEAILLLGDTNAQHVRIDLSYNHCDSVVIGSTNDPTICITLRIPQKFYEVHGEDVLTAGLAALVISNTAARQKDIRKTRLSSIDDNHRKIAGVALVYRITLASRHELTAVTSLLSRSRYPISAISMPTKVQIPQETWARSKERLDLELADMKRFGNAPFKVRFQLDGLARNGRLSPRIILDLLPRVETLLDGYSTGAVLTALMKLHKNMPNAGPGIDAEDLSVEGLTYMLIHFAMAYDPQAPDNVYELSKRHAHVELIHRVVITPAGAYLEGPVPEPTNRVLRQYAGQTDNFLRIVFQDEDGGNVHYDPRASNALIYHERFKGILDCTFNIAGLGFSFLGFSHSSMRSQSCWFMAPLWDRDALRLMYAPQVIKRLGDFSNIRTPAKCAARIGQCFTDTAASIEIDGAEIFHLSIIERNGRDFSDGVGTISQELLSNVWQVYGTRRQLKPTVLQIRFRGAKGVVALDSRLQGRRLCLRSNMEKFSGSTSRTLEICGAALKPLPMVLNRQFVKILEDLGVPTDSFLELQRHAVDRLRCRLNNVNNTAGLMDEIETTRAARISELITRLDEIGVDFRADAFLYSIVEMAVMTKMRDIKYRGRIPVEQGATLYGIMDETGFLEEGEIYVAMEAGPDGGRHTIVRKRIVVTRSPAMHPGDVQLVNAVEVPDTSPLKDLRNVVVFSSKGQRDLPSQLSGGDLDGDLYNVVWDPRLMPEFAVVSADYPKVTPFELNRQVTSKDMSDHFIRIMETDQLGILCNVHMQLADQFDQGTFSAECIKLAGMASTAVDYSKTGIAVNMKECPKYNRYRPDFMSPSPRFIVSGEGYLDLEEDDQDDDDAFEGLDSERRPYHYYESQKALGLLYRSIDERKFLVGMQQNQRLLIGNAPSVPMLERVLEYAMHWGTQYGLQYQNYMTLARNIRSTFEENLLDIMYAECPTTIGCLSEMEVFSGSILGRQGGAQGKPLRELSKNMRKRFEPVVDYAVKRIIYGDGTIKMITDLDDLYDVPAERELEALPRAIACFKVAVEEAGWVDKHAGEMKSFAYVAMRVCLQELQRWRITTMGAFSMPKIDG
ncbi:hypothetical protein LTR86_009536 [Recurvomyces mirabilis]|nr:hypothetical protein LTR86_009536 [Recurvomyces mirabilis]